MAIISDWCLLEGGTGVSGVHQAQRVYPKSHSIPLSSRRLRAAAVRRHGRTANPHRIAAKTAKRGSKNVSTEKNPDAVVKRNHNAVQAAVKTETTTAATAAHGRWR